MKLLICGDRNWKSFNVIYTSICRVAETQWIDLIIEGEAKGADLMGRKVAESLCIPCLQFPAHWDQWGRAAGPIRNRHMLKDGNPDLVLAFHDSIYSSKGTKDMITIARDHGVPVWLINSDNVWLAWI